MANERNPKRARQKDGRQARREQELRELKARKKRSRLIVFGLLAVVFGALAVQQTRSGDKKTPQAAASPAPSAEPGATQFATFVTSLGDIKVKLLPATAPKAVENFVGLATGTKEWTDPASGEKKKVPLYNNTVFHRVIKGFMIQGGDPLGTGQGGPGYQFEDETQGGPTFEKPGMLAMANSGPNTNGSQFFITVGTPVYLNGRHTIFGEVVEGQPVAEAISNVPTSDPGKADRPLKDVVLKEVRITAD